MRPECQEVSLRDVNISRIIESPLTLSKLFNLVEQLSTTSKHEELFADHVCTNLSNLQNLQNYWHTESQKEFPAGSQIYWHIPDILSFKGV